LIAPVLTYLFYVVVKDMISFEKYEMKKTELPVLIPLAANTVLTILSPFYKTIFFIDSQNVYHRGPLFFVSAAITYFYLVYGLVLLIRNRSKFMRQEFIPLVVFTVLPILGGLVQSVFYGTLFMWSSTAFSLVVIYLYLQQRIVQLDDLTGVWSRNSFENYIARSLRQKESLRMGLIYVDLDDLKQIKDLYGHAEGDFAIRASVELIRGVIRKSDTIARMGGDEFVVMLDSLSNDCLGNTMRRIEAAFEEYNKTSGKPYRIGCSFGADVFNSSKISIEQFLHHIDSLMYKNKRLKKAGV
jgi:diguanylate cyclase (GGDEF)-like protein